MMEDKIFNSSYNNMDIGSEGVMQTQICVHPSVEDRYEENLSDNMEDVYTKKKLHETMLSLYQSSKYYDKYKNDYTKIDKCDVFDMYYDFKSMLIEDGEYTIIQIFCEIAEFFSFNYKTLYNNVLTLEDKRDILEAIEKEYGIKSQFIHSKRLF